MSSSRSEAYSLVTSVHSSRLSRSSRRVFRRPVAALPRLSLRRSQANASMASSAGRAPGAATIRAMPSSAAANSALCAPFQSAMSHPRNSPSVSAISEMSVPEGVGKAASSPVRVPAPRMAS